MTEQINDSKEREMTKFQCLLTIFKNNFVYYVVESITQNFDH